METIVCHQNRSLRLLERVVLCFPKVVGKALDYAGSPGYYIAKYWDAHDKYPKNGRINF
ncbi:hypothetical protein LDE05_01890 [Lactobacillus delbrueckii subsp. bulgaricus]|nr:hypothetical protein LDE05_01890 [Lactobacillus delbrueckii subsp. bulgaricus]